MSATTARVQSTDFTNPKDAGPMQNAHKSLRAGFALSALALVAMPGCSADPSSGDQPGPGWTEPEQRDFQHVPPYEQFREEARRILDGHEVFIVETDMLFETEAALRDYYEHTYVDPTEKSIVNLAGGVRDLRPNPEQIKYCFAAGWGQAQTGYTAPPIEPTRSNLQSAMLAWEGIANVRFVYMNNLDGASCSTSSSNPGVDFVVQHYNNSQTAVGPFPSLSWASQQLRVPTVGLGRLLAIHEVGHVIGLRHEHIHSGASPRCTENNNYEELTSYDSGSCMRYQNCTVSQNVLAVEPSSTDGIGTRILYGPPEWWWADS